MTRPYRPGRGRHCIDDVSHATQSISYDRVRSLQNSGVAVECGVEVEDSMTVDEIDELRILEIGTPGAMRQRLNGLILDQRKRATAGLLLDYVRGDEELEFVGERLALVDDDQQRIAVVEVVQIETVPFGEVSWKFAQAEGEGDESLEEWREGHLRFWTSFGDVVDDLTPVVLIRFELVTTSNSR
ncbi:MAG TPA: ASCH domain-containing protein [Acidimicrobiales bacterium]